MYMRISCCGIQLEFLACRQEIDNLNASGTPHHPLRINLAPTKFYEKCSSSKGPGWVKPGSQRRPRKCPELGVERKSILSCWRSAYSQERTWRMRYRPYLPSETMQAGKQSVAATDCGEETQIALVARADRRLAEAKVCHRETPHRSGARFRCSSYMLRNQSPVSGESDPRASPPSV
jgi:hypothetical protein